MKTFLLYLFLIPYPIFLSAQADTGFTNKTEARNKMANGKKEGKWIEYLDRDDVLTKDSGEIFAYRLTIYKAGSPLGLVRTYNNAGYSIITPYKNGKINGIKRSYYESGKIEVEATYEDSLKNGTEKQYYESGKLNRECFYKNGEKSGPEKYYYENGKLASVSIFGNNVILSQIEYDENGNEIKK